MVSLFGASCIVWRAADACCVTLPTCQRDRFTTLITDVRTYETLDVSSHLQSLLALRILTVCFQQSFVSHTRSSFYLHRRKEVMEHPVGICLIVCFFVRHLSRHAIWPQRTYETKLAKGRSRLDSRKLFFSQRVVNGWNGLRAKIVNAESVNSFKNAYDRYFCKDMDDRWSAAGPSSYKYKYKYK